ncbi:hypothetical protein ABH926_009256 [Catenulispora sp. GP43]|uniref:hypothetical protein n=1 Tax=Catenulispora sp. GP43 TaxID=3156263 RepID=UPI0035180C5C
MNAPELAAQLAVAGLRYRSMIDTTVPLLPPTLANLAPFSPADGEIPGGFQLEFDDPDLVERANTGWHEWCLKRGVFDERRDFLVAVRISDRDYWWARVELDDPWDIMGAGAAGILGIRRGFPRFTMMSLDGTAIISGTDWEIGVGCICALNPQDVPKFRAFVESWADLEPPASFHREAAIRWLEAGRPKPAPTTDLA